MKVFAADLLSAELMSSLSLGLIVNTPKKHRKRGKTLEFTAFGRRVVNWHLWARTQHVLHVFLVGVDADGQ
jgi:hypothetical protein